jgi:hypothetical protein
MYTALGCYYLKSLGRERTWMIIFQRAKSGSQGGFGKSLNDGELGELTIVCGVEEKHKETAERMMKVAFWCVQYRPESRPLMSVVVKMLEGAIEIPTPLNPFQHMLDVTPLVNAPAHPTQTDSSFDSEYSTQRSFVCATPVMRKYEIEIAST